MRQYVDHRGEIQWHELEGAKYNLLYSKAGTWRSGDIHPNHQYDVLLKGRAVIRVRVEDDDRLLWLRPNDLLAIEPGIPHLFYFSEDSVLLEWWGGEFQAEYFPPYRKIVDEASR